MSDDPSPAFTVVELEIAELAGKGYGHWRIALLLKRRPYTIQKSIQRMAAKLPNPDGIAPLTLVQLWAAHRAWLQLQPQKKPDHAA